MLRGWGSHLKQSASDYQTSTDCGHGFPETVVRPPIAVDLDIVSRPALTSALILSCSALYLLRPGADWYM